MPISFGIDFGTSNSVLAVSKDGKVSVADLDEYSETKKNLRSVLYFDDEKKVYVGTEAILKYIEDDAAGRYMQSIKAFLSDRSFESTVIFGNPFKIDDLVAIVLRKIKEQGEYFLGEEVDEVVLGRPVVFSDISEDDNIAENRLLSAAKKVGFKEIIFRFEPFAAALTYEIALAKGEEKNVFVGDFGGGTSDFAVIRLRGSRILRVDRRDDVYAAGGINIGGNTFDYRILWEKMAKHFGRGIKVQSVFGDFCMEITPSLLRDLRHWHLLPRFRTKKIKESIKQMKMRSDNLQAVENLEKLIDYNYGLALFQAIERAKCGLSAADKSKIVLKEHALKIEEEITRQEFEQAIADEIGKIESCADDTLKKSGLMPVDIDIVFITGGSSYVPCIRRIFERRFGNEKIREADAFTSVAYGLGLEARNIFR